MLNPPKGSASEPKLPYPAEPYAMAAGEATRNATEITAKHAEIKDPPIFII